MSVSPKVLILEQFMQYSSYVARNCYYIDNHYPHTYHNKFLGVCIGEKINEDGEEICFFQNEFRGFNWQFKNQVYIIKT